MKAPVLMLHPDQARDLLAAGEASEGDAPLLAGEVGAVRSALLVHDIRAAATLHAARYWNHWDNERRVTGWPVPAVPAPLPGIDPAEHAVRVDRALVRLLDNRADCTLRTRADREPLRWMLLLALVSARHARRITTCGAPFAHNRVIHLWRTRYLGMHP